MNNKTLRICLSTLLIIVIFYIVFSCFINNTEDVEFSYFRIGDDLDMNTNLPLYNIYAQTLPLIKPANSFNEANFYFFQSFNRIDTNIMFLKNYLPKKCIINGMNGTDLLVSKSLLARYMKSTSYLPIPTFILSDKTENDQFLNYVTNNPSTPLILKKNIQRQTGVFMGKGEDIYNEAQKPDYVVAQRLLDDPFLVKGHKINIRVYLVIIIAPELGDKWMHYKDGFIYYTPKPYEQNNEINSDTMITSGYIDRQIYEDKPLSLTDLYSYIGKEKSKKLQTNIQKCFMTVCSKYSKDLCSLNADIPGIKFSIFGCDLAPDKDLNVTLMEINKGPDLSYKDERDKNVKYNLVKTITDYLCHIYSTKHV